MNPMRVLKNRPARGFSLVELLVAMVILSVGLLAIIGMLVSAVLTNNRNKVDSTATMAAEAVLEQITARDISNTTASAIKDCAGNSHNVGRVSGSAASGGKGAPMLSGDINFLANAVVDYQMDFVSCGANGTQVTYDVRWNVMDMNAGMTGGAYAKLVTIAARQKAGAGVFNVPVTLRTVAGTQ